MLKYRLTDVRRNTVLAITSIFLSLFLPISFTAPVAKSALTSDALVLNLDGRNSSSVSGSTWSDQSGNGYHATLQSGAVYNPKKKYVEFDGSVNAYATLQGFKSDSWSGFSISFFADFGDTAEHSSLNTHGYERILDVGSGQGNNNIIVFRSAKTNNLAIETYNGTTGSGYCQKNAIANNTWAHYVITLSASQGCKIYVNGVEVHSDATFTNKLPSAVSRTNRFIGKSNWSADTYFRGAIGSLAIYNKTLSQSEVNSNFDSQAGCSPTSSRSGTYTTLTFQDVGPCIWTVPSGVASADILVVGGGGGGAGAYTVSNTDGAGAGGGGGAYAANGVALPSSVIVQVGAGGAGGGFSSSRGGNGGSRGSSSAFGDITAGGGGGGGCDDPTSCSAQTKGGNGTAAGSGGGSSNYYNAYNAGGSGNASDVTFNNNLFSARSGFSGGIYISGTSILGAGGPGGGANGNATYNTPGAGLISNITGSNI